MISDPGQDLDDEMMFIMSSQLHALASKTREVVVMGGCEPILTTDATEGDDDNNECKPDSANNNTFDS